MAGRSDSAGRKWLGGGGASVVPVRIGVPTEIEPRPYSVHGLLVCGRSGGGCAVEEPAPEDFEGEADGCCG